MTTPNLQKKKTPVRITREFFCYSAFFTDLVQNTEQDYTVNILGDSSFEIRRIVATYVTSRAVPTTNDSLLMPDISLTLREVGTDRGFFIDDNLNAMDIVSANGGLAYDLACPVILPARSQLLVTVESAYTDTLPVLALCFMGARLFKELPPPPQPPILVKQVVA